jgi:hypothetical protein
LGNPGIGKSSFGYYVLYRALRAGRTVCYQAELLENASYIFYPTHVERVKKGGLPEQLLNDFRTVYISDSMKPGRFDAFTLLITSPQKRVWGEFDKGDTARMFVFPCVHPRRDGGLPTHLLPGGERGGRKTALLQLGRHPALRAGEGGI